MNKKKLVNIFTVDKPNVCFIGDIHGEFQTLNALMKKGNFHDTAFIVCGDIGLGFEKKEHYTQIFNRLSKTASKMNNEFLFIRGNHDDPKYFSKRLINRKCFKTIPDYSVIETPLHNILCVGGAISIDREYRKKIQERNALQYSYYHSCTMNEAMKRCPQTYWEDEKCYFDKEALSQLKINNINIDIVCTHTCPSFVKPYDKIGIKTWIEQDETLANDIDEERNVMDKIYNTLKHDGHKIYKWFYGHYHYHNSEVFGDTTFIMLDMCRYNKYDVYSLLE